MNFKLRSYLDIASFVLLGSFWLFALMNPVFKKYDYGGGLPLILGIGVILGFLAFLEIFRDRERNIYEQISLLFFGFFVLLSFVYSQMQSFGLTEVMAFIAVIVVYLLYSNRKIEWISSFLNIVCLGTIFAVILGMILYVSRGEVRMFGPFYNKIYPGHVWPNAFALYLLMAWPVFLINLKNSKPLVSSFLLGFIFSALLLSYSRGAILVFCGQLVLLAFYYFRRINLKSLITILLSAMIAISLFFSLNLIRAKTFQVINVQERAGFENQESQTSKQERVDFWKGAIVLAKQKPFLGWGPFSFRYAYNTNQKDFLASSDHPHNVFLKIAAENGIPALMAFLSFLLILIWKILRRFGGLENKDKETVYLLGVAVAGAFAHNMIDYNLNFMVNILLLFIYLAIIRSLIIVKVKNKEKKSLNLIPFIIAVFLSGISLYEGFLYFHYHKGEESYMERSFFPRYHYLTAADSAIKNANYDEAVRLLNREIELSPLSSQAWYLRGVLYCKEDYKMRDLNLCKENFAEALRLNPMNDFNYYLDYFRQLEREKSPVIYEFLENLKPLVLKYFDYVKFNVHFTSYTSNVEAAANLIDEIVPYLETPDAEQFIENKKKMLLTAKRQRDEKEY